MAGAPPLPDWTDEKAYTVLLATDRSGHAWEWLRRDPLYGAAAYKVSSAAAERIRLEDPAAELWGLHAFEDPDLAALRARPVWRAAVLGHVLTGRAVRAQVGQDILSLERLGPCASLIRSNGAEHLLVSDGARALRVDLVGESLETGAVEPVWNVRGLQSAEPVLQTLRRLVGFARTGRFADSLFAPDPRRRRLVLLLRTWDALAAGATQRDIADVLLAPLSGARWRIQEPSLRSQAQRLVRGARTMAAGGFWSLLANGKHPPPD